MYVEYDTLLAVSSKLPHGVVLSDFRPISISCDSVPPPFNLVRDLRGHDSLHRSILI